MGNQRKHTLKRPRKPLKATEVAVILTALGALLSGLAAFLNALH